MASCSLLTAGRGAGACKIIAGVERVYLANSDLIESVGVTGADEMEEINAIGMTGGTFYTFYQIQETSSFTSTPTANVQNGSLFYETILTLVFTDYNASLRYTIKTLAENNLVAIVEMKSGEMVFIGESGGIDISGGDGGSGTASGDRNGASLTFRGVEKDPPMTLSAEYIASPEFEAIIAPNV